MPTLNQISILLGCLPQAGRELAITGIASLFDATSSEISYVAGDAFVRDLTDSKAAAIIASKRVKLPPTWDRPALLVDDAELAVGKVLALFAPPIPRPPVGVDALARVDATATLGENLAIGPFVFVGRSAKLGARTILHPGVFIGDDTTLGDDCEIFPNVTIRERVTVGNRVIIHANSAIGSDGFGYRWDGKQHVKIPQIGNIVIEDDVEIGSCACVDRAKFSTTRIGRGTKIDNLVQVGHNTQIGPMCIITGQVGLAGSVKLGAGVVLGGQSSVSDHVSIGDGSMVAGTSGVAGDIPPNQIVSGIPAQPHRQSLREQKALRRLPDMQVQIRALQEEIEKLKGRDASS